VTNISPTRKKTGNADIGWRPAPEKNIEAMPCWEKKIAQKIASWTWDVTQERAPQSRRLVRRKGASWSLNWPSGANLLARMQVKCIVYVPL